jgi:hypothetical protein
VRADWAIVTTWQKVFLGLALCLPIPALSASGLTLPLPSAVYRVAAAFVESTESLARAISGTHEEPRILSIREAPGPVRQQSASAADTAPDASRSASRLRLPVRTQQVASAPTPRVGTAPSRRTRASQPASGGQARATSSPITETKTGAPTTATAPAPTPEPVRERASAQPASAADVAPPTNRAPVTAPPPAPPPAPTPPAVSPPSAPPPALLEPVTKTLEPVTKPLQPVIQPLAPVTDALQPVTKPVERLTGRLGILHP